MTDFLGELFSLSGRVAVVTGGSSGIGEAMASALALAGEGGASGQGPDPAVAACAVAVRSGLLVGVG